MEKNILHARLLKKNLAAPPPPPPPPPPQEFNGQPLNIAREVIESVWLMGVNPIVKTGGKQFSRLTSKSQSVSKHLERMFNYVNRSSESTTKVDTPE